MNIDHTTAMAEVVEFTQPQFKVSYSNKNASLCAACRVFESLPSHMAEVAQLAEQRETKKLTCF